MGASRGSQGELVVSKNRFQGTSPGSIVMKTTMMITVALSSPPPDFTSLFSQPGFWG